MTKKSVFEAISYSTYRVSGNDNLLSSYLVHSSEGLIQVNAIPELFKLYYPYLQLFPKIICLTQPQVTPIGDTYTGIEFVLWAFSLFSSRSRFKDRISIVGQKKSIQALRQRLSITMKGDFVSDENGIPLAKLSPKSLIDSILDWKLAETVIEVGKVRIEYQDNNNVCIYDNGKLIFNSQKTPNYNHKNHEDSKNYFENLWLTCKPPSKKTNKRDPSITVVGYGDGIRPGTTSSFIVDCKNTRVLIDPPARPHEKLAQLNIHSDTITDYIVSHCHEDHIEGFSAALLGCISNKKKMNLMTSKEIYKDIRTIFNPIFGYDIDSHISFHNVWNIDKNKQRIGMSIEARENYHTIPTLGFKFSGDTKSIGISGDTLYNQEINRARFQSGVISKQAYENLSPRWFEETSILLHEVATYKNKVHTSLADLEELATKIPNTTVYAYHHFGTFQSRSVHNTNIGTLL